MTLHITAASPFTQIQYTHFEGSWGVPSDSSLLSSLVRRTRDLKTYLKLYWDKYGNRYSYAYGYTHVYTKPAAMS